MVLQKPGKGISLLRRHRETHTLTGTKNPKKPTLCGTTRRKLAKPCLI